MRPIAIVTVALLVSAVVVGCRKPNVPSSAPADAADQWFEDSSEAAGISFVHDPGPVGDYFMPQIMGSGAAFLDFNNDGRLDVFLLQNAGAQSQSRHRLFVQTAAGRFSDVTDASGINASGYGMGVAAGDVNNDGWIDLVVTEYGKTLLYVNSGAGRFRDATAESGIDNPLWGTSTSFFDYDRDGWLDLIVVNYLDYDRSIPCTGRGGERDYCGPKQFPPVTARLFRNLGSDTGKARFQDVTLKSGLAAAKGKGLGVLCADFDGDHWPDIFVANDMMANHLWINQRNGTFKEEAVRRSVGFTGAGAAAANMGVAWADVDGNRLPDLFVTHIIDETHTLWMQESRGYFQDRTVAAGLTTGWRSTGFGTAFVDLDRDGWPDALWVNGGVRRNADADRSSPFWQQFAQRNQLFANTGDGKFRDISASNPALCDAPFMGRGLAVGDYDNDGAPDLLITQIGGPARLLRNVAAARGHWLAVRAAIPKLKRDAYGAEITVRAGSRSFWRLLNPGYSYCSSNDPRCYFGLGANSRYDAIEVVWPDGTTEAFPGGIADRAIELRQGEGTAASKSNGK